MDILVVLFLGLGIVAFLVVIVGAIPRWIRDAAFFAACAYFLAESHIGDGTGKAAAGAVAMLVAGLSIWGESKRAQSAPNT